MSDKPTAQPVNTYISNAKETMRNNAMSYKADPYHANVGDTFGNMFTGNLDFAREVALADRAEAVSAYEAQKARDFSSREAQKQREWEEMMSSTAYSRAVKDLKSVGINPYAIGSFNAASTPSGAYGQSSQGQGYKGSMKKNDTLKSLTQSALQLTGVVLKIVSGV